MSTILHSAGPLECEVRNGLVDVSPIRNHSISNRLFEGRAGKRPVPVKNAQRAQRFTMHAYLCTMYAPVRIREEPYA